MSGTEAALRLLPVGATASLGCDPEIFIVKETGRVRKRKAIIGSEAVIPEAGLPANSAYPQSNVLVRDGVQVELHPPPDTCRASISNSLTYLFNALDARLRTLGQGFKVDFSTVVTVGKRDLAKLSEASRKLGCQPSLNIYGDKTVEIDGATYMKRSAAGHIHFGSPHITAGNVKPERLVRLCDVILGNTFVLLDRDPGAAERRKHYGRAGEYRLPKHGLEYRTLSNFWLKYYPLMSLVFGMAHQTFWIASGEYAKKYYVDMYRSTASPTYLPPNTAWDAEAEIMAKVDLRKVEEAINTNSFKLAKETYDEAVRPFFAGITATKGLSSYNIDALDYLIEVGIDKYIPADPFMDWCAKGDGHGYGWESTFAPRLLRERQTALAQKGGA